MLPLNFYYQVLAVYPMASFCHHHVVYSWLTIFVSSSSVLSDSRYYFVVNAHFSTKYKTAYFFGVVAKKMCHGFVNNK